MLSPSERRWTWIHYQRGAHASEIQRIFALNRKMPQPPWSDQAAVRMSRRRQNGINNRCSEKTFSTTAMGSSGIQCAFWPALQMSWLMATTLFITLLVSIMVIQTSSTCIDRKACPEIVPDDQTCSYILYAFLPSIYGESRPNSDTIYGHHIRTRITVLYLNADPKSDIHTVFQ